MFAGTIWVQQGSRPLADDADEVLRGAAVLAARIMSRLAATPSTPAVRVQELLGLRDGEFDITSQVVRRVTGRPAESVRTWVAAHPERFERLGVDARRARTIE